MNLFKKYLIFAFCILSSTNSHAFRTVKHTSFTDPEFQHYKTNKILLMVNTPSNEIRFEIEKYLVKYFSKSNTKLITFSSIFPPTRNWTKQQITNKLLNSNIDSWLVINQGIRNKTVTPFMTTTNSNTNVNGTINATSRNNGYGSTRTNGTFNANANTNSNTYTTNLYKSTAEFNATVINVATGKTVWVIDLVVKAGGALFTTNKGDAKGVSKRIVKVLIKDGIVNKK